MQSPFEIFRKHQKMLTVVLTGLAMFAFVILGAVPDPANMPPALTAIFLAGVVGGLAWVAGIRKKKSNEWGLLGVIAGLILGIAAAFAVRPGVVVRADTGNIDNQELNSLFRQRAIANQFVNMAYQRAQANGAQMFQGPPNFGFGHPDETRDIVVGELLRREADRLGMQVTDETVNDFIRSIGQDKLGASDVREIRNTLGLSETGLYEALKGELKAYNMARFLYGGNALPPVAYWDFYRKMNVQESVGIVPIPVEAFIDQAAEPTDAELQKLFAEHKANFPNFTAEGRPSEGEPGFHQPRKVALEFVEIPFEAVEKTIGEITDAEVEAYYEENYKSGPVLNPPADGEATPPDAPMLPELQSDATPDGESKPAEKPESESAPAENAAPAEETPEKPAAPEESPAEEKPETPASDDAPASTPETETPADDTPESEATDDGADTSAEEGTSESDANSSLHRGSPLQLVAFLDDEKLEEAADDTPAAEATNADDSSTEEPDAEEQPATESEAPAEEKPAEPEPDTPADKPESTEPSDKPESGDAPPAETSPDAPAAPADEPSQPRALDDELRAEIREQILRRKTAERQQELMTKTYEFMSQDLAFGVTAPVEDPSHVTPEATTEKLKAFAEENGLVYERTPLLSQRELSRSEEFPIGRAVSATNFQSPSTTTQMAFGTAPTDLFRPEQVLDIESGSRFVFWKVEDVAAFIPESLEAPGIREQVVAFWRQLQARDKAKARAEELAKQAQGVDKPLSEVFAGATVTGVEGGQSLRVIHPPRFSWLSAASAQMSPNPFNRPAPTQTELRTVPGDVGEEFMETVFNDLNPGEVGVAHSFDLEYFYVVRVDERTYGPSADLQAFRDRFTTQPVFDQFGFSDYSKLAARELGQYQTNWANELFERHKVDFSGLDAQRSSDVET